MVFYDVGMQPRLQPVTREDLNRGANKALDTRLDMHARGFSERHRSTYFDDGVFFTFCLLKMQMEDSQLSAFLRADFVFCDRVYCL